MQICSSLQTDNHASTPPLSFLQAGCPSCCPANIVKALKGFATLLQHYINCLLTFLLCHPGLINSGESKDWTQFAADPAKAAETASMSSESVDDVWCITDEQHEYYVRQFSLMQDDMHGVISGIHTLVSICNCVSFCSGQLVRDELGCKFFLSEIRKLAAQSRQKMPNSWRNYCSTK